MAANEPQIDLICNVVIRREDGKVLLTRYESDSQQWWLPGRDLIPYEHPNDVAPKVLEEVGGFTATNILFKEIESFRGRSGWHVMFNYLAEVSGEPASGDCQWFAPDDLPQTAHGSWERGVVERAVG